MRKVKLKFFILFYTKNIIGNRKMADTTWEKLLEILNQLKNGSKNAFSELLKLISFANEQEIEDIEKFINKIPKDEQQKYIDILGQEKISALFAELDQRKMNIDVKKLKLLDHRIQQHGDSDQDVQEIIKDAGISVNNASRHLKIAYDRGFHKNDGMAAIIELYLQLKFLSPEIKNPHITNNLDLFVEDIPNCVDDFDRALDANLKRIPRKDFTKSKDFASIAVKMQIILTASGATYFDELFISSSYSQNLWTAECIQKIFQYSTNNPESKDKKLHELRKYCENNDIPTQKDDLAKLVNMLGSKDCPVELKQLTKGCITKMIKSPALFESAAPGKYGKGDLKTVEKYLKESCAKQKIQPSESQQNQSIEKSFHDSDTILKPLDISILGEE